MSYQAPLISFIPGENPEPDETNQNTRHIIESDNVRFYQGGVEKAGGFSKDITNLPVYGTPRTVMSFEKDNKKWQLIGTNSKLYAKLGTTNYNITPLQTSGDTLGTDPIATRYDNVQTNPFNTTSGSDIVSVNTFMYDELAADDYITISGVGVTVNGIPAGDLNKTHRIISMNPTSANIRVDTAATSTSSPAVASVVITVRKVKITDTAHGLTAGDRIKLSGATGTIAGIAASEINKEHVISVVESADTYVVSVSSDATGLASGGGSSVERFKEIAAGGADAVAASGAGIGIPGYGLPGSIQTDTSLFVQPRVWWMDMFGDVPNIGVGQGGACYTWAVDPDTAPTAISNAPDADLAWVEDAKLVVIEDNVISNSDVGDNTSWTPGSGSSAYSDAKEDANKVIARCPYNGSNLIFTEENKVFLLTWIGGTLKWRWQPVSNNIGICGRHGVIVVGGIPYVFGEDNFYYFNGGAFVPLPNNTLRRYVFDDINRTQKQKFFVWYNKKYSELNFHYCSGASPENDRAVIYSIPEQHWTTRRNLARTAADSAGQVFDYPILASPEDGLYQHEVGVDADGAALDAYVQVAYAAIQGGKVMTDISGMEPDLLLEGSATLGLYGKDRSMNDGVLLDSFTLTDSTDKVDCGHETRWRSWLLRSNEIGGDFRWGGMREFIDKGSEF